MSATAALTAVSSWSGRPTFAGAVRSELLKLGRHALTWVLVAGFAAVSGLVLGAFLLSPTPRATLERSPSTFYFTYLSSAEQVFTIAAGALLLIVSSRLTSMEYGNGTIRIVLARGTGRLSLLAAQYVALAVVGLLLLAGFAVVAAAALYAAVVAWHGSFSPITSLPAGAWTDTGINVLVALLSIAVCILLGTAAAVLGRSVAFGVGAAVAFFPTDNFGTLVLSLVTRLTHQDLWSRVTAYLLGPVLNQLPVVLQTDHPSRPSFATPLQPVDATHCWVVIAVYTTLFLATAVVLTWRRDVLH